MLPGIIGVVSQACEANNEEDARWGFDVIETLLILVRQTRSLGPACAKLNPRDQETPLLAKNIPELVQFCLTVGANKNTEDEIRQMALNALNWTIK